MPTPLRSRSVGELVGYLNRATGRPEGALTPLEARQAIEELAIDGSLAERAERLVAGCDQVRYSSRGGSADELVAEARPFFTELGHLILGSGENHVPGKHRERHSEPPLGEGSDLPLDDQQSVNRYLRRELRNQVTMPVMPKLSSLRSPTACVRCCRSP